MMTVQNYKFREEQRCVLNDGSVGGRRAGAVVTAVMEGEEALWGIP